jgi:hypothetical protein
MRLPSKSFPLCHRCDSHSAEYSPPPFPLGEPMGYSDSVETPDNTLSFKGEIEEGRMWVREEDCT